MNRELIEYMKKIDKLPHGERRTKLIDNLYRQTQRNKRKHEQRLRELEEFRSKLKSDLNRAKRKEK